MVSPVRFWPSALSTSGGQIAAEYRPTGELVIFVTRCVRRCVSAEYDQRSPRQVGFVRARAASKVSAWPAAQRQIDEARAMAGARVGVELSLFHGRPKFGGAGDAVRLLWQQRPEVDRRRACDGEQRLAAGGPDDEYR